MKIKDAIIIMLMFGTFVIAILTYIPRFTWQSKNPPQGLPAEGGFL